MSAQQNVLTIFDVNLSSGDRFPRVHHEEAYLALSQALRKGDSFERRLQLDSWLKQHGHPLEDGLSWERGSEQFNWSDEYLQVINEAIHNGFFYSDAFQKQLYHCYIETGRISLQQQQKLHHRALNTLIPKAQSATNAWSGWLGILMLFFPLIK